MLLEPGWVQAGIWYIGEGAAEVISVSPPAAWETEDELTGAADAALSSAVAKLPENYEEPTKTVFGVPAAWVKGGEISEEYLGKIKSLCTDLSLNPVGFVVLPEAVAHLYKSEEGSPLSAIILGLGKEFLEISVFKLGNLVGTTQVSRSVSLIEDVTEGLSRFEGASPLPSRFIVYDGKGAELSEAKEALLQEGWQNLAKMSFLHTPKAETVASDRKVLATSLAGANEIGQVSKVASKEVGEAPESEEIENVVPAEPGLAPEELGFAVGADVTQDQKPPTPPPQMKVSQEPQKFGTGVNEYFQKTKSLFSGFTAGGRFNPPKLKGMPLATLSIVLAAIAVLAGLFWWFYPRAKVTIYVTPKTFQEEVDISLTGKR